MQILQTIKETRQACAKARASATKPTVLGLIPTMGALHEGHLSLIRTAKKQCEIVVATIFVNPTQFGPNEDFSRYPRTFASDCALLEAEGVDILFAPSVEDMYPTSTSRTFIEVPGISDRLDGLSRPGHFRGVATVVAKLFHIVSPDRAYFGQKDAAQVAVLRAMVHDLNFPVEVIVCPTVRDADGLALSSRNQYLSPEERTRALALSRSLGNATAQASKGTHDASQLKSAILQDLQSTPTLKIDYVEIVDPTTLEPIADLQAGALIAVAAWIGKTRLIDNALLSATPPHQKITP
ncbi:pantothenate synthetase [Edaphobacter aggregans]|uniref:Pantothenate synthetase n=1 Tax=Edaphobacter aggregans TaxID=570835 RepID=A0A428MFJ3_9BACT|nr:pantoate--beta-alanine ligase [Edaphobacter aggregans]RSL15519.1 pantothenate synthetase [Edaphobacter aggregans]